LKGNYWYFFGIHITKAGDNGIKVEGSYNIVERCVFSYCGDTGLQLGFGHTFSDSFPGVSSNNGSYCAYNLVVDCDSYQNYDYDNYGSDADGFACKMHNGLQNWFVRCRAWNNSDDAWDLFETDFSVYIVECWAFHSGDASQHPSGGGSFQGNGNGIKLGGNGTGGSSKGKHEAWNCVAFNNNKTNSVKGFDQNSHSGGIKLVNCLAFNNGYDFMFETAASGTTNDFYNNVCLSNRIEINSTSAIMQHNVAINNPTKGWANALTIGFSAADYNDLSEDVAKMPRGSDGSLPTGFARLKPTSQLIDRGVELISPLPSFVGQPLVGSAMSSFITKQGSARDLGPYETISSAATAIKKSTLYGDLQLRVTTSSPISVTFVAPMQGMAVVEVVDVYGRLVGQMSMEVVANVESSILLNSSGLGDGVYLCRVTVGSRTQIVKFCNQK
jgi:pectate disaccharide-lyase